MSEAGTVQPLGVAEHAISFQADSSTQNLYPWFQSGCPFDIQGMTRMARVVTHEAIQFLLMLLEQADDGLVTI